MITQIKIQITQIRLASTICVIGFKNLCNQCNPCFCYIAIYDIKLTNPHRVSMGIDSIFIDGQRLEDNILPLVKAGTTHKVEVTMGRNNLLTLVCS